MAAPLDFDLGLLPVGRMTMPRILGGVADGGTSLSGISQASDISGGGLIAVDYINLQPGNVDQGRLRFLNRLALALNGGVRTINIPLLTDWIAPVQKYAGPILTPFSDGSTMGDGGELSQDPASGFVVGAQSVDSGTIAVSVIGGTGILEGGEWFGLQHSTKGFRAYGVTDIDAVGDDGNGHNVYTVGIRPTLREAIADGSVVYWWRPKLVMRLLPGFTLDIDVDRAWWSQPAIKLIEAF